MKVIVKKLVTIVLFLSSVISTHAQFTKARLQATGLTCAMCSNAINKALQKVPFVETVKADIKNSAFDIVFRKNADVDIDALRKAVEDAGFFVGGLEVTGEFHGLSIPSEQPVTLGKDKFYFLQVTKQVLNGEKTLRLLDKKFVTAKEFKKLNATVRSELQKGEGVGENIYHVTI
jgi:copper chaperone CopZ